MEAILNENKDKIFRNFSLSFSVVALVLSLISIVGLNKLQNKILNGDIDAKISNEKSENLKIDAVQEVEVLHSDGSTEKVKAKNSEDKISMVIEEKIEKPKTNPKKENSKKKTSNKVQKINVIERKQKENKNNFYIQLGIFSSKKSAKTNCDKIKKSLANKTCFAKKESNNRFASVIQGFETKNEATRFAKKLAEKESISFLIKKSL